MTTKSTLGKIPIEHERRFVPVFTKLPFATTFLEHPMSLIIQGYIEDDQRTRVREEHTQERTIFTITMKTGSGISRPENEIEIARKAFKLLWEKAKDCSLRKSRYFICHDGIHYQLNIFHGAHAGYVQIEVEFDSNKKAVAFVPPPWLGKEVTHDKAHGNYSLAKYGRPE